MPAELTTTLRILKLMRSDTLRRLRDNPEHMAALSQHLDLINLDIASNEQIKQANARPRVRRHKHLSKLPEIRAHLAQGRDKKAVAKRLGIARSTLYRLLAQPSENASPGSS